MTTTAQVLLGAQVRTMRAGSAFATVEALAWRDGRIVSVGSRDDVLRAAGDNPLVHDVVGATVLPGFIDAHHHPALASLYGGPLRLCPPAVTDIASLQGLLARAAAETLPGRWIVALDWDEMLLSERRPPTRKELDDAVPDHPLMAMHYSCHRCVANSRALELAGISRATPDPAGGSISRGAGRHPDGLLVERGMSPVETLARASLVAHDAEGYFERLTAHHRALVSAGITRVVDATVPPDLIALYREAARRGLITVPTVMMPVSMSGYLETPWDALDGPVTGDEDGPLTVGPLKLVFDGAPTCAMCLGIGQTLGVLARTWLKALEQRSFDAFRASMSLRPSLGRDGKIHTGITIYSRGEAEKIVRAATDKGFTVAIHAIGNAAVEMALAAHCPTANHGSRSAPPRIEHGAFLTREMVSRIADRGIAVVSQPYFVKLPAVASAPAIPGLRYLPHRWLLDAGVAVAGSSDYPVARFDPLEGIRSAVTRRTVRGDVNEPDQRVTLDEALAMYTRTAAEVSGCLDRCGTLEVGKRADIVVLDGGLHRDEDLDTARVRATLIGGEIVHGRLATEA